jgi:large subunit ribosomal protein L31
MPPSFYSRDIKIIMQQDIHPSYNIVTVTCSCGNSFKTRSTLGEPALTIEVCSKCHPFYTGKQKIVDTSGRVDKFKQKYGKHTLKAADKSVPKEAA